MLYLVTQLCLTLCDPMDCSPPGSCVHRILQTRILEWVAMPSSRGSGDLPNPGIKPGSPALQVDSLLTEIFFTKPLFLVLNHHFLRHRLYTRKENTWDRDEFFLVPWFRYIKKLCAGGHRDTADACLTQTCSQKSVRPQPPILGNWKKFPQHNFSWFHLLVALRGTQ